MAVRFLLAALVAGMISGVLMTGAQYLRVTPLILHAEQYEGDGAAQHDASLHQRPSVLSLLSPVGVAYAHGEMKENGTLFGASRFAGTLMANLVTGAGFALLLAAVSILAGVAVTPQNGLLWGACGWLAAQLLPALGLPPELPGFPSAELHLRQLWWIATVVASAAGLYLALLRFETVARIVGVALIVLPHVFGAPQPTDLASNVPAVLGAEYAVAALATTLFFWLSLGWLLGRINERFGVSTA